MAILDKQDKYTQLNIIDCVGDCVLVKNVNDVESVVWRPEDKEFINVGIDYEAEVLKHEQEFTSNY